MAATLVTSQQVTRQQWWREAGGSVADLGVLIPIAVALIVANGLSVTAVLLPAGAAYLLVAAVYRVPVSVQPLKAFGALAIAVGAGADLIAAGALLMGVLFLSLGASGAVDRLARFFGQPVIRGVQLAVGLTFGKIAWGLVTSPPANFVHQAPEIWVAIGTIAGGAVLLVWRGPAALLLVGAGMALGVALSFGTLGGRLGPTAVAVPALDWSLLATALTLLVLPQVPLTFANSCLAPADAAVIYFGRRGATVRPGRLAITLGGTNVAVAAIGGMPLCHGAGGMSAHYAFGARTWRAPVCIGSLLVVAAVVFAAPLAIALQSFPLPVLAALLVVAAITHVQLLRDVHGWLPWLVVVAIGLTGLLGYLVWGVLAGVATMAVANRLEDPR